MTRLAAYADNGNPGFVESRDDDSLWLADFPDGNVTPATDGASDVNFSRRWQSQNLPDENYPAGPLFRFRDAMRGIARDMGMRIAYAFYDPPTLSSQRENSGEFVVIGPYPSVQPIEGNQDSLKDNSYRWIRRIPPDSWDAPLGGE